MRLDSLSPQLIWGSDNMGPLFLLTKGPHLANRLFDLSCGTRWTARKCRRETGFVLSNNGKATVYAADWTGCK